MSEDLLTRATAALRDTTHVREDAIDDVALERLEQALAAPRDLLADATRALREAPEADLSAPDEGVARLERALSEGLQERATEALRDETHVERAPADDLAVARLEDALRGRRTYRRSRLARYIAWPIAAVFFVMVGWASASGRLAHWISVATHGEEERPEHERNDPKKTPVPAAPPPRSTVAVTPSSDLPPLPSSDPTPIATAEPSATPVASLPSGSVAASAKPAGPDADALYRAAHEAHFVKKDSTAALAAWDRYLAAAPHGRFALEAKYNRAITLVRLGRRTEAAAALRPFANGDYGNYRKEEARELLQTLE